MSWDNKALSKVWDLKLKKSGKTVSLGEKDIKSSDGGEGIIYLKGNTIYKVYPDNKFLPPEKKFVELQRLQHPSIVVPQDFLFDNAGHLRGFTMPYHDAHELCKLFPKAFKDRHKIQPATVTDLVKLMQAGTKYLHSQNFLQVDGNEMNYLVSKHFDQVFFIDSNSFQTPSFPATAIMESIRDPHSKAFNKNTDWYSWGIVTFQMFIGIHPFKGIHSKGYTMQERMAKNISVFNPDVTIPAVCGAFNTIPSALRDWYEAVFERGLRQAPPDSYESRVLITSRVTKQIGSDNFLITALFTYQKPIIDYAMGYTMTENGVYKDNTVLVGLNDVAELVASPTNQPILARLENHKLKLFPVTTKVEIPCGFAADEIMSYQGRLYVRNKGDINEVTFVELGGKVMPTVNKVGSVIQNNAQMFEGCVTSSFANSCHISVFPKTSSCYQLTIPELANYRVVDAKFDSGVLILVARDAQGVNDKFVFRFDAGFKSYDVRIQKNIQVHDINFVVLDTGVVLHMTDTGVLECFKAIPGAKDIIEIDDQAIDTDCLLLKSGNQAMFARGEKLYKFSMQPKQAQPNVPKGRKGRQRDKNTGQYVDIGQVQQDLIKKDPVFADIYKDPLIGTIIGKKPTKVPPTSGNI
jgi:serine/threonine protein kinase